MVRIARRVTTLGSGSCRGGELRTAPVEESAVVAAQLVACIARGDQLLELAQRRGVLGVVAVLDTALDVAPRPIVSARRSDGEREYRSHDRQQALAWPAPPRCPAIGDRDPLHVAHSVR